jgi:anti-sigma regulatory factor (Ser/Thr protein kinase)
VHVEQQDFRHYAMLYAGDEEFLEGAVPFIREGLQAEEPVLVMVPGRRVDLLRSELGSDSDAAAFADMTEVGANPGRIIPAWREFAAGHAGSGRRLRGIGEPIWAERTAVELVECQHHETLLNVAFADGPSMLLLCPYDTNALDDAVLDEARRSHPLITERAAERESEHYRGLRKSAAPFHAPLPDAPGDAAAFQFDHTSLDGLRAFVSLWTAQTPLSAERQADLVLALNELASNSVRHGGGGGVLRMWDEPGTVVSEVSDSGRIDKPLAGRELPGPGTEGGHGLWLVNQLCDLMQMRTFADGSVVRVHMHRDL